MDKFKTEIEQTLYDQQKVYCGVDEAGAGPLCGDVVAAAVIINPTDSLMQELDDSKKLTEKKREKLFILIKQQAISYCIARATPQEIDELNILQARMLAMSRAIAGLSVLPDYALIDGNRIPNVSVPASAIIKGDSLVVSISAASILAKVQRDHEMVALDKCYPGYGLAQHKGYPTKGHIEALNLLGVIDIYRKTFKPVKNLLEQ
jgi:ribonuclease HII